MLHFYNFWVAGLKTTLRGTNSVNNINKIKTWKSVLSVGNSFFVLLAQLDSAYTRGLEELDFLGLAIGVGKACLAQFLIGQNLKWSNLIGLEVKLNKSCLPLLSNGWIFLI